MKLNAKYDPAAPRTQRWKWELVGENGEHVNGSHPEGFGTVPEMRANAKRTGDGIWEHFNPFKGRVIFSNEYALAGMVKKAKGGTIREGDIITFGGPTKIGRKTYPAGTQFRAGKDAREPAKKAKGAR